MFSRTFAAVIAAVLLSLGLGACTQKSSGPINQKDLSSLLQQNGLSKKFADCVAQQMHSNKEMTESVKKAFNQNNPSQKATDVAYDLAKSAGQTCKGKGLTP